MREGENPGVVALVCKVARIHSALLAYAYLGAYQSLTMRGTLVREGSSSKPADVGVTFAG
jgi:hypothetical protein